MSLRTDVSSNLFSKAFELVKGKHIGTGSRRAALIHEVFAKKNHLKPGDKFEIRSGEKKITLKVVGIFSGNDKGQGVLPSEMVENNIFTDLKSAQALNLKKGKPEISKAWYFTKNPKIMNEVVKKAKMQNLPWGKLSIRNESEASKGGCFFAGKCRKDYKGIYDRYGDYKYFDIVVCTDILDKK